MPQAYRGMIQEATHSTGVASNLLAAVMDAESSFNPKAGSSAGAIGLMQLMPDTAKGLGVNPYDDAQNILGGAKYLGQMLNEFGSKELALAAYNSGPGRVHQAMDKAGSYRWDDIRQYLPKETQNYVPKVLSKVGG